MRHTSVCAGFSLIELMIVVGIISILAAGAIPQYQNYDARARLTEAVQVLGAARVGVAEYFISRGFMPANAPEAGIETVESTVVKSLVYTQSSNTVAILSVEVQGTGNSAADGKFFSMDGVAANGMISWNCRPGDKGGRTSKAVPSHLLPGNCRGIVADQPS